MSNQDSGAGGERKRVIGTDGTVFKCPICQMVLPGTQVASFPFCSERCRMVDLGNWLEGKYTVSRAVVETDEEEDLPKVRPESRKIDGENNN